MASPRAQPAGQLAGVVRDATGAVLPGVQVTVTGPAVVGAGFAWSQDSLHERAGQIHARQPARRVVTAFPTTLSGFEARTADVNVGADAVTLDLMLAVSSVSETVTVTATRTGVADIQTTPIAITALSGRTLDQLDVQRVGGLTGVVPSVTMSQQPGSAQVTIRGIGTNSTVVARTPAPRFTSTASISAARHRR